MLTYPVILTDSLEYAALKPGRFKDGPAIKDPALPVSLVRVQLVSALETYRALRAAYVARGDAGTRFRAEEARDRVRSLTALLEVAEKIERAGLSGHPMEVA